MGFTKGRIDIISMGCSKNLVDSEKLIYKLAQKGYDTFHDVENPCGEYVVINTCGFINDAKEESVNMILNLIRLKQEGRIGNIIVMGCLSERYLEDLKREIPEVEHWFGKFNWNQILDILPDKNTFDNSKPQKLERTITTPPWSAYVKVSEGCDRFCAFCAIPHITGRHTSRPLEEILDEVKALVKDGVKEFNVIAQDLSSYGKDLYGNQRLPELIDRMAKIPGVEWIRLHYLYPSDFPMEILDVMNNNDNVCKYIDLALQHISDPVLKNMNRHITSLETKLLLMKIREKVPGIHIRTTLMVGFPGEGEAEYEELLAFVEEEEFDRMGAFAYSEEDDTLAAKSLKDKIPQNEKQERLNELMELQEKISEELNEKKIGTKLKVLVERKDGSNAIGRSEFDSPEVDQEVTIINCHAEPGEFAMVEIIAALPFELLGKQID